MTNTIINQLKLYLVEHVPQDICNLILEYSPVSQSYINFKERYDTSHVGKLNYKNGYYDFVQKKFIFCKHNLDNMDDPIIDKEFPDRKEKDMEYVNKFFFEDPFNDKTGFLLKKTIANAMAGFIQEKRLVVFKSKYSTGHSTRMLALMGAFGRYVTKDISNGILNDYNGSIGIFNEYDKIKFKNSCVNYQNTRLILSESDNSIVNVEKFDLYYVSTEMMGRKLYEVSKKFDVNFTIFLQTYKPDPLLERRNNMVIEIPQNVVFSQNGIDRLNDEKESCLKCNTQLCENSRKEWFLDALTHIILESFDQNFF